METPLHSQKIAILSRLIKESSLTLEEALLLLKEEEVEQEVDNQSIRINHSYIPGTTTPWTIPNGVMYTTTSTGTPLNLTGSNTTSINNTILDDANL